jgi:DNA-binding protein Fis
VGWQSGEQADQPQDLTLSEVEKAHIHKVLMIYEGRRSEAALALGIDRKTLREKIRRYGLDRYFPSRSEAGH